MSDLGMVALKSLRSGKPRVALLVSMSVFLILFVVLASVWTTGRSSSDLGRDSSDGLQKWPGSTSGNAVLGDGLRATAVPDASPSSIAHSTYFPIIEKDGCEWFSDFQFDNGILTVNTRKMVLAIEGGAVIYVQDRASAEVLVNTRAYTNRPSGVSSFVGFMSQDQQSSLYLRWPTRSSSTSFSRVCGGVEAARLIYSHLDDQGTSSDSQLIVDVTVDASSGEVILQLTGVEADSALKPSAIDMPIMNMTTPAVILGSGAKYVRAEAAAADQTSYSDLGLYSPTMAVVEGMSSTLAVWSETTQFAPENILLDHKPAYDHLVLHAQQDPKQTDLQKIVSPSWRIGTYSTWVKAAQRWRAKFEERTGAKPLWANHTPWVRNIHAVYDATNQSDDADPAHYAELASKAAPAKVLYFLWNGDRTVLHGDHTLVAQVGRPTPALINAVKGYGWPFMLFHPYTLIYSVTGSADRLQALAQRGWLPTGYQFNPDYEGTPQNWRNYWADVSAGYPGGVFDVVHPGSTKFKNYLVRNVGDYCALYQADGVYLDTSGDNTNPVFADDHRVVEGQDYTLGEINAMTRLTQELPNLAFMSEYQSQWMLPYAFYSWEGSVSHVQQNAHAHTRINHPLRVALTGSYAWTRESNSQYIDDITAALLGTLPQISLVGDYNVSQERALWSQARARLFTEEELFNDVPDTWTDGVLAYYRSKSGNWFAFKTLGSTYGYVEILPNGQEVVRLQK